MLVARTSNIAFADAIRIHLDKLEANEKFAFLQSHQDLSAEAILSRIRDNDRDYHVGSTSRKCAAMVRRSLQFLNKCIWCVADAIQNIAEISSLVARGVKLILDEDLVESKYLLCKRSIRYGTTRANMFSTGASSE